MFIIRYRYHKIIPRTPRYNGKVKVKSSNKIPTATLRCKIYLKTKKNYWLFVKDYNIFFKVNKQKKQLIMSYFRVLTNYTFKNVWKNSIKKYAYILIWEII